MNINLLTTIKDFDIAVNLQSEECVRISEIPKDMHDSEISLIFWLLLEFEHDRTLSAINVQTPRRRRFVCDGNPEKANSKSTKGDGDDTDGASGTRPPRKRVSVQTQTENAKLQSAKNFAENLLRKIGVNLPWDDLSPQERQSLFMQFCATSELLKGEKLSSTLELYQALRKRSKFREQFEVLGTLGSGNFGNVYSARCRTNPEDNLSHSARISRYHSFAVKKISLTLDNTEEIRMILNESNILKKLNGHPNIVSFYESWIEVDYDDNEDDEEEPLKFYLQMEMCGASLQQWKELTKTVSVSTMLEISSQLCYGLDYIHSKGIIHLDINPKNILWGDEQRKTVKIGDFGLAIQSEKFEGHTGTWPYYAPETIKTFKSDMYSLGVTFFELSQNICTMAELCARLERKQTETGMCFMDEVLPSLLDMNPFCRPSADFLYNRLKTYV